MFSKKTPEAKAARQQAVRDHKQAKADLHATQRADEKAGVHEETDTYLRLTDRVLETEQYVPWYRR